MVVAGALVEIEILNTKLVKSLGRRERVCEGDSRRNKLKEAPPAGAKGAQPLSFDLSPMQQ
jgi:hypothetical protein